MVERPDQRAFLTRSVSLSRRGLRRLHVGPQNGVDPGLIVWSLRYEPLQHVLIQTHIHAFFVLRSTVCQPAKGRLLDSERTGFILKEAKTLLMVTA